MTRKELAELNKLTSRYIYGRLTDKDRARLELLMKKRDEDAMEKIRKREEKRRGRL
jgi:hypothetical protein